MPKADDTMEALFNACEAVRTPKEAYGFYREMVTNLISYADKRDKEYNDLFEVNKGLSDIIEDLKKEAFTAEGTKEDMIKTYEARVEVLEEDIQALNKAIAGKEGEDY